MAEDAAIVAKAREVAEVLRREKLAELAAKKRAMVVETLKLMPRPVFSARWNSL